jgi:tetratricopeptide (TPR) repeat protein
LFEPLVKQHPEHLPLTLTLGQALVHHNRSDEGIELLRNAVAHHPDSPEAWDAWLKSLALTPEVELLASEFRRLPHALASDPRFAKHEGMVAHYSQDLAAALRAYRRAFAFEPYNQGVIYRFRAVLAQAGETAEFERVNQYYSTFKDAFMQLRGNYFESPDRAEDPAIHEKDFKQSRGAYFEVRAIKTLGVEPHPRIYQRLADLREKMGRADEARAWHRQVLRDDPEDAVSLAALKRLK